MTPSGEADGAARRASKDAPAAPDRLLEESFKLALEATGTAIWDWDIENKRLWNSPGVGRLTGRGDTAFTQHFDLDNEANPWLARIHPEDREAVLGAVRDHLERDRPLVAEYRFRAAGDDYVWLCTVGRAVRAPY